MTYFLPNGITDDSLPQKSHNKASFGPIGGRSISYSTNQSRASCTGKAAVVSSASGASYSKRDVDFNGLFARPCAPLATSRFGSSRSSVLSCRPPKMLLSDLRGDVRTLRASSVFKDSGGSIPSSSSPFGRFGSNTSGSRDTEATRSPTLSFDGGQEAAKGFSMQGESRRSIVASESFGMKTQQLDCQGTASSFLRTGENDSSFGSRVTRKWPAAATEASQPTRVIRRPPGLDGPPGRSEPPGIQSCMSIGSGVRHKVQQRVSNSQSRPFELSNPSPFASEGAFNRTFSSGDNQNGLSSLSSLRSSTGGCVDSSSRDQIYSRDVSNLDLAELNTNSIRVGEMDTMLVCQAIDASYNREPTTSRRIDIQVSSKTQRSPKKARDGRRKANGRSSLRTKALEFSTDATKAFASGSPTGPKRSDRVYEIAFPINAHGNSPSVNESSRNSNNPSVRRSKRRNLVDDKDGALSLSCIGGNDSRWRESANQSKEPGSMVSTPPGLKGSDRLMQLGSEKSNRREETKPPSRTASRTNLTRRHDRGTCTSRRQVYREKREKESMNDLILSEKAAPMPASLSRRESPSSSDGPMSGTSFQERGENIPESSAFLETHEDPSFIQAGIGNFDEAAVIGKRYISTSFHDEVAAKPAADIRIIHASRGEPPENVSSPETEREPSLASDIPEYEETVGKELVEQAQVSFDQQLLESKKKFVVSIEPPTESSPCATNAAAALCVCPQVAAVEKKCSTKEHRKEKSKKEKPVKKKTTRGRKDKRGSSSISKATDTVVEAQDKLLEALATKNVPVSARFVQELRHGASAATRAGVLAYCWIRRGCVWVASRLNMKGLLATTLSYAESVLTVGFSVVLLLILHAASWFIRIHRVAFRAILTHRHIGFCFAFLYGFPFLVQYVFPWAPPWAPVCLWYAFLAQLFCTNGPTAMVTTFRVILPLVFLVEGISYHSFLLDLNGAERLLTSFIISALKTSTLCSPICFLSLATQCLLAVFLGSKLIVQWLQLVLALYSLHVMAATDDEWLGIEQEDDPFCHRVSTQHPLVDYNRHPTSSSTESIQKIKGLDRQALAYVRGRKLR